MHRQREASRTPSGRAASSALPHVFEDAIGAAQAVTEAEPSLHKNAMSQEHGSLATPIRPRHPYAAAVVSAAVSPGVRLREATWCERALDSLFARLRAPPPRTSPNAARIGVLLNRIRNLEAKCT